MHYANTNVNHSVNTLIELYQSSSKKMLVKPQRKDLNTTTDQPWWDIDCDRAKYRKYAALRRFRSTNQHTDYTAYIETKRLFKKICAHKKSNYNFNNRQKLISSRKNPKIFWQLLKQNTNKSKNIENTCNLQIWKNHFENLLYKENQPPLEYSNFAGREDNNENILNEIITLDEIHKSIRKLKLGKAQGTDGIGAEFYRYTCYEIAPILCTLFNNIYSTGNLPDMWRDSIVIPVYKSGLRDEPANYRGISLINVMYKIFSNILYDRLRKWAELNNKIDEAQSGFRAGYSTTDNIFILQSLVQKYLSKQGGRFYVLYVDFKKAFDSVVHQNLFNCLKKYWC